MASKEKPYDQINQIIVFIGNQKYKICGFSIRTRPKDKVCSIWIVFKIFMVAYTWNI